MGLIRSNQVLTLTNFLNIFSQEKISENVANAAVRCHEDNDLQGKTRSSYFGGFRVFSSFDFIPIGYSLGKIHFFFSTDEVLLKCFVQVLYSSKFMKYWAVYLIVRSLHGDCAEVDRLIFLLNCFYNWFMKIICFIQKNINYSTIQMYSDCHTKVQKRFCNWEKIWICMSSSHGNISEF